MGKVFKSKVDNGIILLAVLSLIIILAISFLQNNVVSWLFSLLFILLVISLFFDTNYIIKHGKLIVKSSFFINQAIDIKSIKKIRKANKWEKAPALSWDRFEISYNEKPAVRYNFYNSVIISPENKENFIQELKAINPKIEIDL